MLNQANFHKNLTAICPNSEGGFLLAVSGGADSMVLLHLFREVGLQFEVAHINYKLRGEDSDLDQKTVEEYCLSNHIKFHLYEVSPTDKPPGSVQLWARDLRYDFFRHVQKDEDLEFLVTAHHLNDQLETFLINLSRGSGIRGLSGIPADENKILRPLLPFTKEEIYSFAAANKIGFREDLSNQKNDYLRNMIRNEITPKLVETNPHFLENFSKSLKYLHQVKDFAQDKITQIEDELLMKNKGGIYIDKKGFVKQEAFVQREILRKFGFEEEEEIAKILKAENGKVFNASRFQLLVDKKDLIIRENSETGNTVTESEFLVTVTPENKILIPNIVISTDGNGKALLWNLDGEKIKLPLKIRKKKDDDLFFPIGMLGKKKIAKFLKDEKLPILARQEIWLLCDGNDDILGVIPLRQDRRFTTNEKTRQVLTLEI